jgi:GMP synthase-like glutamine amidotransferase
LLFVRCDPVETFGVGAAAVEDAGADITIWEALEDERAPALDDVSGVVLFGSTFNVEHAGEQPFIGRVGALTRQAVEGRVPFLGLCFGAQILAWSVGSEVRKAPVREVGFEPVRMQDEAAADPILGHFRDGDPVFHWHMDTFEVPDGATLLATGDGVRNQALRLGDAAWATQFHLVIDAAEAGVWMKSFAEEGGDLATEWGKTPEQVQDEIASSMEQHEARGREVFRRFVEVAKGAAP